MLGAPPGEYDRFADGIRAEYGFVGEQAYNKGRAAFLRGMLERRQVYRLEWFVARYEASARVNMARELLALEPDAR